MEVIKILTTSEKMNIILKRNGKNKKWLAEQWKISQPSITKKFQENNWKESDLKKFCIIMNMEYEIMFIENNGENI